MYGRLLRFLRPHYGLMVITILSRVAAAGLEAFSFALLIPFLNALFGEPSLIPDNLGRLGELLQATIGALLDPADLMGSLQNLILVILGAVIVKNLFVWWGGQTGAALQELVTRDMRDQVYGHVLRLPMSYHTTTKAGQTLSRVLSDTEQTKQLVTQLITQAIQNVATVAAYLYVLVKISAELTLVSLVIAPLLILALQPLLRKLRRGYRTLRNDLGEMTSVLQEVLNGTRLVKSYTAEGFEERRFRDANLRYSRGLVKVTRYAFLSQPVTEVIGTVIAVGVLWLGAREVLVDETLQGAQLIVFLTVVMRLLQPLKQLSQLPTTAQASFAAAERLFDVLDRKTEAQIDGGTVTSVDFQSELRFENVSFAYGDGPVLNNVSLVARRGEIVALVGPSGAGKTTLVDLIPRFNEPTEGRILLDGRDIRDIRLDALRCSVGIVSQETILFNDTVRRNIAYGVDSRYTNEQVVHAAELANAHEFIEDLPNGYDTILGERGTRLSGGQRQRLSIARALLLDPPILIFDEATSALDTESERLVQEAIDRLLTGRTVFVIAHRLSTVTNADQIIVLDRGALVERGTHSELLAGDGLYARLHAMQFRDISSPAGV